MRLPRLETAEARMLFAFVATFLGGLVLAFGTVLVARTTSLPPLAAAFIGPTLCLAWLVIVLAYARHERTRSG